MGYSVGCFMRDDPVATASGSDIEWVVSRIKTGFRMEGE